MARQDINMDASYGEVNLTDNLVSKVIYTFEYIGEIAGMDNDRYGYGEVMVPDNFETTHNKEQDIHVHIPYIPEYKSMKIRFVMDAQSGNRQYIINRSDNSNWFLIKLENTDIHLSEYFNINEAGIFNMILRQGVLYLYSGAESDFFFKPSLQQNKVFLLKSLTGNLYQHPTSGVGLINYLHANFETSGLSAKLLEEFEADGMIINDAYMNSLTGELVMNVTEKTKK